MSCPYCCEAPCCDDCPLNSSSYGAAGDAAAPCHGARRPASATSWQGARVDEYELARMAMVDNYKHYVQYNSACVNCGCAFYRGTGRWARGTNVEACREELRVLCRCMGVPYRQHASTAVDDLRQEIMQLRHSLKNTARAAAFCTLDCYYSHILNEIK